MPKKKTSKEKDNQPQLPLSNEQPAAEAPAPEPAEREPIPEAVPAIEEPTPEPRVGKVQDDQAHSPLAIATGSSNTRATSSSTARCRTLMTG